MSLEKFITKVLNVKADGIQKWNPENDLYRI